MFHVNPSPPYVCVDISLEVETRLERFRLHWAAWQDSPKTENKFLEVVKETKEFLTKEKDLIFRRAKANGWPTTRGRHDPLFCGYRDVYHSLINSIENFLNEPNIGSGYMINEQLSQLYFLLTHRRSNI
jgi:hypothetical protein